MFWVITPAALPVRCRLASARWPRPGRAAAKYCSMAKRRRQASLRISWLARKSSNWIGRVLVHSPPGERKVRNAALGRDAGAGKRRNRTRAVEQFLQPVDGSREVRRDHICFLPDAVCSQPLPREHTSEHTRDHTMRYLHTMLRVRNLDQALDFYVDKLGLQGGPAPGGREKSLHAGISGGAGRRRPGSRRASGAAATRR